MSKRSILGWVCGALIFGAPAGAADSAPEVMALHHTPAALRATYRKGVERQLPRLLLFDGHGQLLLVEAGFREGAGRRLVQALARGKPLSLPLTLEAVLAEAHDAREQPVSRTSLPKADGYIVDYWASWCTPCHLLERDIERQSARWGRHVVWIKIESDPEALPENSH